MLSAISWAAVYFVIWWTTLFAVLPFANKGRAEDVAVVPGADSGAPASLRIGRTFLATTLVASAIFGAVYAVLTYHLIGLDDVPFLPRFDRPY
ncbi:DUF1467 family protein [Methylopila sp. M107]|uniref:DUF1467 family protein n=1 Tax=Methylopila sp. M107 TaxID=1101190 RepID=UPI000372ED1E|nr:DUF1467 family protein [Methylopila sp. M107]